MKFVFICLIIIIMPTSLKAMNEYSMLVMYIQSSVCLRFSQFSQLSFVQYMGLCICSLPVYIVINVRICILYLIIIIKSEVWINIHYSARSWNNGVRCMYPSILINKSLSVPLKKAMGHVYSQPILNNNRDLFQYKDIILPVLDIPVGR